MKKDIKTEWDLRPLFDSDNDRAMEKEREEVEKESYKFINKWKGREDYLSDSRVLEEALSEFERWSRFWGTAGKSDYYFWLRTHQNQNDPELKAKFNKIDELSKRVSNDAQFFHLKLAKIPKETQKRFLEDSRILPYRHFLEKLFLEAEHLLSEPEEKILTLKSNTSYENWVKMLEGFLSKEEREVTGDDGKKGMKSFEAILKLAYYAPSKKVRDGAARAFNDILNKNLDVAEAEINSVLMDKKVQDELRKFPRPDSARHLGDDIDTEVVDALIEEVGSRNSIPNRYYGLKAKLLGVPRLAYHERNLGYGKVSDNYSFEEAVRLLVKVFGSLDPKFSEIFSSFVESGSYDVYPRKNKANGAFCVAWLISQPTYLLLNHTGKLNDVLTLAHETGHGINDELMKESQNALSFGTPKSTAEVASTFMEDFVLAEIMKEADDEARLSLMMRKLDDDINSIFRQVAFYRFEQELHRSFRDKGYLSKEEIGKIFRRHMEAYMGKYVEQSEGAENWWVYVGHFRMYFYVYSYASGLLISKALQNSVKENPKFISKVKEFLAAGTSDSPKNIFAKMGIDISDRKFWKKGIDEVENLLKETEKLARRLGKIK